MAIGFKLPTLISSIRRFMSGDLKGLYYEIYGTGTNYIKGQRLKAILENPAALFLFKLIPDLASMAVIEVRPKGQPDAEPFESHPLMDLLNDPNPMQTGKQFIWDYMFWRLLGCANMYSPSRIARRNGTGQNRNIAYFLSPDCIHWPNWFQENRQTLFLTPESIKELNEKKFKYHTHKQKLELEYEYLKQFHDISNGIDDWFDPPSRVDALYKVLANSQNTLDAKNINSQLSRKVMVAGKHKIENTSTTGLTRGEKKDIEDKILGRKNVHAMSHMVDIKRFLERAQDLGHIDESFMNDAFIIGKNLHIPRDVIESLSEGSTYENQEKARASLIYYSVSPAMEDFAQGLAQFYEEEVDITFKYDHLPFVQTFEKERAETLEKKAIALWRLVEAGANQEQAAIACGLDLDEFNEPHYNRPQNTNTPSEEDEEKTLKLAL